MYKQTLFRRLHAHAMRMSTCGWCMSDIGLVTEDQLSQALSHYHHVWTIATRDFVALWYPKETWESISWRWDCHLSGIYHKKDDLIDTCWWVFLGSYRWRTLYTTFTATFSKNIPLYSRACGYCPLPIKHPWRVQATRILYIWKELRPLTSTNSFHFSIQSMFVKLSFWDLGPKYEQWSTQLWRK